LLNLTDTTYIQLTQAEAAFRTAKSDLGLRAVFHHREDRVLAHILACFLALAPWRILAQWMQAKGLGICARQLVKEMAGIKSVDVNIPVKRAGVGTQPRLRVLTTPDPAPARLLAHLGLRLPQGSRLLRKTPPRHPKTINYRRPFVLGLVRESSSCVPASSIVGRL